MIYDPMRRVLELRQCILERMTAEELEAYAKQHSEIGLAPGEQAISSTASQSIGEGRLTPPE